MDQLPSTKQKNKVVLLPLVNSNYESHHEVLHVVSFHPTNYILTIIIITISAHDGENIKSMNTCLVLDLV